MADEVLVREEKVLLVPVEGTNYWRWEVAGFGWFWGDGLLSLMGHGGGVSMVKVPTRDQAVQWSLGYVAGRRLPWGMHDVIPVDPR